MMFFFLFTFTPPRHVNYDINLRFSRKINELFYVILEVKLKIDTGNLLSFHLHYI